MSFSSDQPQITTLVPQTINLPDIENKEDYSNALEGILRNIAESVNGKEAGQYLLGEKGAGQYYAKNNEEPLRNIYRKTFDFAKLNGGSINSGQTIQYPHEIENLKESAGILAHCTSVDGDFFTASYPDICLNRTSIVFVNPHAQALSQCDVVANFLKE